MSFEVIGPTEINIVKGGIFANGEKIITLGEPMRSTYLSDIYHATISKSHTPAVVKIANLNHPQAKSLYEAEIETHLQLAELHPHRNIVPALLASQENTPFIATELAGPPLTYLLRLIATNELDKIPSLQAKYIMQGIQNAIDFITAVTGKNTVDLKLNNVLLLDESGQPADFSKSRSIPKLKPVLCDIGTPPSNIKLTFEKADVREHDLWSRLQLIDINLLQFSQKNKSYLL